LPRHDGVHLVGYGLGPIREVGAASAASVLAASSAAFKLTVVDLPRSLGPACREAVRRCDLVVLICPRSFAAAICAQKLLGSFDSRTPVMVVTRAGQRTVEVLDIADLLSVPLLIEVGDQRGLDEALAAGFGPLRSRGTGLRRAATSVLDELDIGL
jgi:hypothetical protein